MCLFISKLYIAAAGFAALALAGCGRSVPVPEATLALAADAWSRTHRVSVNASALGPVKLRSGLVLVARPAPPDTPRVPLTPGIKPVRQLDRTLCEIAERFGEARRDWAAIGLEYPGTADACVSRA